MRNEMTRAERLAAAKALMAWFVSQDMDEAEACDVMSITFAAIFSTIGGDHNEGCRILTDQIKGIIEAN